MTYTPVIPTTLWETYRQDINDFLDSIIVAFQGVVPGVVRKSFSEIPETYTGELPLIYLGELTEAIVHDSSLRHTHWEGSIGYVDTSPDNRESNTRANTFADYFREVFTANARIFDPGILAQTGLREGRATQGPLGGFQHLILTFVFDIQNGRN